MKNVKKIPTAALMAILAATGYAGYTIIKEKDLDALRSGQTALYEVKSVLDGDTFELADGERVRLLGIDAPERDECYFEESKEALRKLVEGKKVELQKEVTEEDQFGRLLRHAVLPSISAGDNILVEEYMVKGGYAISRNNPRDKAYSSLLSGGQSKAIKEGKGLWGACDYKVLEGDQSDIGAPSETCSIKGNVNKNSREKTYFVKGCANYSQVKMDPKVGNKYFCSEAEAQKAGFRKATNCPE